MTTTKASPPSVGIVGAGITGLASALLLVEDGHSVTVVARNLPGDLSTDWASPWAGALIAPHPDWHLRTVIAKSVQKWIDLCGTHPEAGIKRLEIQEHFDDRGPDAEIWYRRIYPDMRPLLPEELAPGATLGFKYTGVAVDPSIFLPWLLAQLQQKGVRFIRKEIFTLNEAKHLSGADIIVNASGLGSRVLASDDMVHPVRGQTIHVYGRTADDQPTYATIFQGDSYSYVIPRASGGFIVGGVSQADSYTTQPDDDTREDILRRVNHVTKGKYEWIDLEKHVKRDIVGFRPARRGGIRIEREGRVVHAYGVGGFGYVYSFGLAARVKELLRGFYQARL